MNQPRKETLSEKFMQWTLIAPLFLFPFIGACAGFELGRGFVLLFAFNGLLAGVCASAGIALVWAIISRIFG